MKGLPDIQRALRILAKEVHTLEVKIDMLLEAHKYPKITIDNTTLLALPDYLQKTLLTVIEIGKPCSASEVCERTRKARAVESGYLNRLAWQGLLLRYHQGRRVLFESAGTLK